MTIVSAIAMVGLVWGLIRAKGRKRSKTTNWAATVATIMLPMLIGGALGWVGALIITRKPSIAQTVARAVLAALRGGARVPATGFAGVAASIFVRSGFAMMGMPGWIWLGRLAGWKW